MFFTRYVRWKIFVAFAKLHRKVGELLPGAEGTFSSPPPPIPSLSLVIVFAVLSLPPVLRLSVLFVHFHGYIRAPYNNKIPLARLSSPPSLPPSFAPTDTIGCRIHSCLRAWCILDTCVGIVFGGLSKRKQQIPPGTSLGWCVHSIAHTCVRICMYKHEADGREIERGGSARLMPSKYTSTHAHTHTPLPSYLSIVLPTEEEEEDDVQRSV